MSRESERDPNFPNEYRDHRSRGAPVLLGLVALAVIVTVVPWLAKHGGDLLPKGRAPEIVAAGWVNGEAPTKAELTGKVVVICVWATWCGPCRREAPHLVELHRRYSPKGVVFLGLTTDNDLEKIHQFLESAGITWPNGWGALQTIHDLEAEFIPAAYIIGTKGQLMWASSDGGELSDILERVLQQEAKSHP